MKYTSVSMEVKLGISHSSVMGPLLFIIYMNDVSDVLDQDSSLVNYADDTSLIVKSASIQNL